MGFLNKVGSFLKREAKDLGEAAEGVKDQLDEELTRREAELSMTPAEKISAIQRDAAATDARFEAIADRASGRGAKAGAAREMADIDPNVQLPNVTHIVLPDGRVKSGNDMPILDNDDPAAGVIAPSPGPSKLPPPRPPANLDTPATTDPSTMARETAVSDTESSAPATAEHPPPPASTAGAAPTAEDLPPPPAAATESASPAAEQASSATAPSAPAAEQARPAPMASGPGKDPSPGPPTSVDAGEQASPSGSTLPSRLPSPRPPANVESPDYGKTPAQIKYERARAAANELLDELRGELTDEGEI